jgi:translation elongation factor EF-4
LKLKQVPKKTIQCGDVGYLVSGIKDAREVKVGDTITSFEKPADGPIDGFEEVKPMVFAGIYPIDSEDFEELRFSLEKLRLNDASWFLNRKVLLLLVSVSVADFWECFTWKLFRNVWTESSI